MLECDRLGLNLEAIVVLADRQRHPSLNVWPGMMIHDIRRELINIGAIEKCDKDIERNNPLIIALDNISWLTALPFLEKIRTWGCILKVNDLIFDEGFNNLLPELSVYGRVMVDLKGHDIPQTVENTCRRLARHKPWAVTVHASGGPEMIRAAKRGLEGTDTKVLAVTVLTSLDDGDCKSIYSKESAETVRKLAFLASTAKVDGFVCSPHEVQEIKLLHPGSPYTFVTPGIRSKGISMNDQARISTPKGAIDNGADYIVMGRQILQADDPIEEIKRILREELGIGNLKTKTDP